MRAMTPLQNAKALYVEGIAEGNPVEAINAYSGDRYTQHSTGVKDGKEGFIEFFDGFMKRNPVRDIQIVRAWEDGQYVFLQVHQNINNGEAQWVTTDFFDTDANGKLIEHWDVISAFSGPNPSGHTQIDGPTEITDLDKTEANKATVRDMINSCLMAGATTTQIEEFVAPDYVPHSAGDGGIDRLNPEAQDKNQPVSYNEIVLIAGKGNFVATLCKATQDGTELAQVDIFRLDDGTIVEHWDNAEPVPSNNVNSGKF